MVKKCLHILPGVLLCLFALAVLSPVAILAVQSVTGEEGFTLSAYGEFFVWQPTLVRSLVNSLLISLTASGGTIVVALLAAYVFAKVKFHGSGVIFYLYIIMMLLPFQVTMLPQYIISKNLTLYDTPAALILPGIFSPFAVFLLTQVMKSVPGEILEAARLDTGHLRCYLSWLVQTFHLIKHFLTAFSTLYGLLTIKLLKLGDYSLLVLYLCLLIKVSLHLAGTDFRSFLRIVAVVSVIYDTLCVVYLNYLSGNFIYKISIVADNYYTSLIGCQKSFQPCYGKHI